MLDLPLRAPMDTTEMVSGEMVSAEVVSGTAWDQAGGLAREAGLTAGVEWVRHQQRWINEQHVEICRVPSPTFQEQQRASHLIAAFGVAGQKARLDPAGNVIVPIAGGRKLPYLAVTAHMDTVLAPRRPGDIRVRPDGGFEGPGVTDNGPGLAALLALAGVFSLGRLVENQRRNILLVANVAEEGEGNLLGMKYLCEESPFASRIDAYLVLDGASIGHITAQGLGSRRFEIGVEGRGGHSWNDYGRANPVHALGRAIGALAEMELPAEPKTTLTVGMVEGGAGVNSIPSSARAKVDIRSGSESAIRRVVARMEAEVQRAMRRENQNALDTLSNLRIREIGYRPAAAYRAENRMAACVRSVDQHLGIRSRMDCASTDANIPLALGKAAAAIGAGGRGGGAHSAAEWYSPDGRALGLERILLAVALMMSQDGF